MVLAHKIIDRKRMHESVDSPIILISCLLIDNACNDYHHEYGSLRAMCMRNVHRACCICALHFVEMLCADFVSDRVSCRFWVALFSFLKFFLNLQLHLVLQRKNTFFCKIMRSCCILFFLSLIRFLLNSLSFSLPFLYRLDFVCRKMCFITHSIPSNIGKLDWQNIEKVK